MLFLHLHHFLPPFFLFWLQRSTQAVKKRAGNIFQQWDIAGEVFDVFYLAKVCRWFSTALCLNIMLLMQVPMSVLEPETLSIYKYLFNFFTLFVLNKICNSNIYTIHTQSPYILMPYCTIGIQSYNEAKYCNLFCPTRWSMTNTAWRKMILIQRNNRSRNIVYEKGKIYILF